MLNVIKKKFCVGDTITIRLSNTSFTGKIDSFEEHCIVLTLNNGITEIILGNTIIGVSCEPSEDKSKYQKQTIETENNINVISKIDKNDDKPFEGTKKTGLTIVGYIDPAKFEKQKKKDLKKSSKYFSGTSKKFSSLQDLSQLILPELEEENKRLVPANGIIINYFPDRKYGFLRDSRNNDIWFHFNGIIDKDLPDELKVKYANIPVLFSLSQNYKGNIATYIHKPKSVEKIILIAKNFIKENKIDSAIALITQILESYPDNITAANLKNEIILKKNKKKYTYLKSQLEKSISKYYPKARELNTNKNYQESLKYYMLALENNERRETCIKDIAMLLVAMDEFDKAVEFIEKYERELPLNSTTYNYLYNFYLSVKRFDKVIFYTDLLLKNTKKSDKIKFSKLLSQKGFSMIKLENLEKAKIILEEAVKISPDNNYANRLLEALNKPNSEELKEVISEAEFDSFSGGFSKFIKDTLEKYNDYYGLPAKVIDSQDFVIETLNSLRSLIERAGRSRPRERANYLLTEAKLMQILEPEKDINLRSVLARYCNAMALNHISENSPMDTIRFYYTEAFSLEESWQSVRPQVALYLISYESAYSDLLSIKTPSIDEALKHVLNGKIKNYIWEGILTMFLWNRGISAQIIIKFFENADYKEKSLTFLNKIGVITENTKIIKEYKNYWSQAREKWQREFAKWFASIKSINIITELNILAEQLYDSLSNARQLWLTQLDNHRLNMISTEILDVVNLYLRQSTFDDKERNYNFALAQINQLITEINENPTKFSYEGFLPLLEHINLLLEKSFASVLEASTPKVKINVLGESNVVFADKKVQFQICVSNSADSSPIRDVIINIINTENVNFIKENNIHYDSVKGGADCIFKLIVQVSESVIKDKATTLNVLCNYKTRNNKNPITIEQQLSLRLYSENEFKPIENVFAPVADGGPVENKKMFYGRAEFIRTISSSIMSADSKQVIIYGQKRSGKSSVLYHLKNNLEFSKKTFCVLFSLGDIIENLTSTTFYYKILSSIEEELNKLKFHGNLIPVFECPAFSDFNNQPNPSDYFRKLIVEFKRACKITSGWENKKLIVLIDEFTYLYTAIRKGTTSDTIMKQWKAITQNEEAKFSVVLVGQDVVPSFKNEEYAKNAFGVIQDIRLTYLARSDAELLIQEPVWDNNNNSGRYIGRAVDSIIDYTSCNPYYIQIFCARLVDYMNRKKIMRVTEADVKEVADSFIGGEQALTADKFDNLLRAGEKFDFQEIPVEDSVKILRKIAVGAKNIGYCPREYISIGDTEYEEKILRDLTNREVLEKKDNNFKIQVKLFQEWLLRN